MTPNLLELADMLAGPLSNSSTTLSEHIRRSKGTDVFGSASGKFLSKLARV